MILNIDMAGDTPIYTQIRNQIVFGIANGQLLAGEHLPTVRQLAGDIGVNPMTVNKAYSLLKEEGFILMDRRHGAQINTIPLLTKPLGQEFDQRAALLIAEARIKGVSKRDVKERMLLLVDNIFQQKEEEQ